MHNNELTVYGHSLAEMNSSVLMDRVDAFCGFGELLPYIAGIPPGLLLDVDGVKYSDYLNVYFDTEDFNYYHSHHNGKLNRIGVRHRHYVTQEQPSWKLNLKAISETQKRKRFLLVPALL